MLAETRNWCSLVFIGFGVKQNLETSGLCKDSSFVDLARDTGGHLLSTWTSDGTQNTPAPTFKSAPV